MSEARTLAVSIKTDAEGAIADVQALNAGVQKTESETKKLAASNAKLARDASIAWRSQLTPIEKLQIELGKVEAAMAASDKNMERDAQTADRLRKKIEALVEAEKKLAQAEVEAAAQVIEAEKRRAQAEVEAAAKAAEAEKKRIEVEKKRAEDEAKRIRKEKGDTGNVGIKFAESEAGKMLGGGRMAEAIGSAGAIAAAVGVAGRVMDKLGETTEKYAEVMKHAEYSTMETVGHLISATPIIGTFFNGADRLAAGMNDVVSAAAKWLGYSKETVNYWKSANIIMAELAEHGKQMDKQFAALAQLREMDKSADESLARMRQENELLKVGNEFERERLKLQQERDSTLADIAKEEEAARKVAAEGKNNDASVFTTLDQKRAEAEETLRLKLNEVDEKQKLDTQKKVEDAQKEAAEAEKKRLEEARKMTLGWINKFQGFAVDLGYSKATEKSLKEAFQKDNKRREEQKKEAENLTDSAKTPIEKAAEELAKAKKLLESGAISQDTFDRTEKKQINDLMSNSVKTQLPTLAQKGSDEDYRIRIANQQGKEEAKRHQELIAELKELVKVQEKVLEATEKNGEADDDSEYVDV